MPIDYDDHDNVDDNEDHLQVLTDPHSPGQFRVNGPFKNLPEFSQVRFHGDNIRKSFEKKELITFVEVAQIDNSHQIVYRRSYSLRNRRRPTDEMINIR